MFTLPSTGDEAELEAAVAANPSLVEDDGDAPLALVQRQVTLPDAGLLDLLAVDATGLPVAVEVKLARNGESRRLVVAQVVDYVASLTRLTVDELDRAVNGGLETALRSFEPADSEDDSLFERRWQSVGVNLRAGLARIVLVLDDARDDLQRIVRFLADHSNFDIRLVTVAKYATPDLGKLFVPSMLLSGGARQAVVPGSIGESGPTHPELLEVAAAYGRLPVSADVPLIGNAKNYRLVRPINWPPAWKTHYEFYQGRDSMGVELHLEADLAAQQLRSVLIPFAGTPLASTKRPIVWDPAYFSGRGRLRIAFELSAEPAQIAQAMAELIEMTRGKVSEVIQRYVVQGSVAAAGA